MLGQWLEHHYHIIHYHCTPDNANSDLQSADAGLQKLRYKGREHSGLNQWFQPHALMYQWSSNCLHMERPHLSDHGGTVLTQPVPEVCYEEFALGKQIICVPLTLWCLSFRVHSHSFRCSSALVKPDLIPWNVSVLIWQGMERAKCQTLQGSF